MKGLAGLIILFGVFVAGALYGVEKNNEKFDEAAPVHQERVEEEKVETESGQTSSQTTEQIPTDEKDCRPSFQEEDVPWITRLAAGIGEGVAVTFNGLIVVASEIIQAG
ncbi:hypothetical protein JF544_15630 [Halobacillus kuroshimensis]|uniref:Uncharacterized protein n=1 Tax=Halobacillus kuroshimensis TaxID=302481 RepID=A0ABS3DZA5_9BACI|nr:hypothetical protein [Halobacillus kuroshimensis]MBN8236690.1 hypothetical protein [Halobacillus kuroshimensis]